MRAAAIVVMTAGEASIRFGASTESNEGETPRRSRRRGLGYSPSTPIA